MVAPVARGGSDRFRIGHEFPDEFAEDQRHDDQRKLSGGRGEPAGRAAGSVGRAVDG